MTAPWICRRCEMLCIDQEHFTRHRDGDHSLTTESEWERHRARSQRKYGASA